MNTSRVRQGCWHLDLRDGIKQCRSFKLKCTVESAIALPLEGLKHERAAQQQGLAYARWSPHEPDRMQTVRSYRKKLLTLHSA